MLEKIWPARRFPAVKRWRLVGIPFFVAMATVSTVVPLLLPAESLATHRLVVVLGLDPLAAAVTNYIAAFYSFFQHLNVRTPQCLGYFIQRPEAHCVRHQRNVHAYNYGDLPIWDMVFGTFRSPATFEGSVGFDGPALPRFAAILAFHDVNDTEHVRGATMDAAAHTAG
mgnify:CR=1 FL=1